MGGHLWRGLVFLAVLLWVVVPMPLIAQAVELGKAASDMADLARQKDIVWLSLIVAIVAIGFSAWLVKCLLEMQRQGIQSIDQLTDEMREWRSRIRSSGTYNMDETPTKR